MPIPRPRAPFALAWMLALGAVAPGQSVAESDLWVSLTGAEARVPTGEGVTIAILDRGIDWKHPDFRDENGNTRILWMLDMSGQSLCWGGNPAPVEYSRAQIDAALAGGTPLKFRDAVGHGTITAGNGRGLPDQRYRGVAPKADLIIVKLVSEGAPAHGNQPAEAAFQGCLDQAFDWLDAKLDERDQPAVALVNSGTQWGPIDGTSALSRKIEQVFGDDRPGRIFVAPSGDEGCLNNHALATYDSTQDTVIRFNKSKASAVALQAWFTGQVPAKITVAFDDGFVLGPLASPSFTFTSASGGGVQMAQYAPGQQFYPWSSDGPDRALWMTISGHKGGGELRFRATGAGTGTVDVYGDLLGAGGTAIVTFDQDRLTAGRLIDIASGTSGIVAGAHVALTSWVDVNGVTQTATNQGLTGELWSCSAGGPTRDGRSLRVDVTAPGHNLFAAYAPKSWWATSKGNLVAGGQGLYGRAFATSGAAPLVAGAVALMLEVDPTLTASEARRILRSSARSDAQTGVLPTETWGHGKLDVLRALFLTHWQSR